MTQTQTKSRAFIDFSLKLLKIKKLITAANLFCNSIIFSHQAAVTYFIRQILNNFTGDPAEALQRAYPHLLGLLAVAGVRVAAIMSCAILDAKRAYYYQNRIRLNAMQHLMQKRDITLISGKANQIFEILDDDIPVATFPAELLTEASGYAIYTLIALSMLLSINWQLTLFIFVPLSGAIYGVQRLSERMKERRKVNREAHDVASAFIGDIADVAMSVKSVGAKDAVLHRYDSVNGVRRVAILQEKVFNERVELLLSGSVAVGSAVMMFIAARLLAGDSFGIGDFSFFIAHLFTLSDCVYRIVEVITEARKAEVSYERILSSLECEPEVLTRENELSLQEVVEEEGEGDENQANEEKEEGNVKVGEKVREEGKDTLLQVRNLTYTYTGNDGFHDVSFDVFPGQLTVIAGGMASGKSTLLSALMNLLPYQKGTVLVPSEFPDKWNSATVEHNLIEPMEQVPHDLVVGAPQRSGFFATDLETNLKLGQRLSDEEIARGLNIAALVNGDAEADAQVSTIPLTTEIGGRGDKLSGGQRQRLLLARVFARPQPIKVIDDCVSALDAETRELVLKRITVHLNKSGEAVIIATNELAFVQQADQIIFMEKGQMLGMGTYEELMVSHPELARIVNQG
jgi:ATP-binding cassette subfamily B protein